jgi:hypothetical protein
MKWLWVLGAVVWLSVLSTVAWRLWNAESFAHASLYSTRLMGVADSPGDLAGSTQKNPGKPRLRILGSACRRIAVLLFVLVCF